MWCVLASTEKAVPTGSGAAPSISTGSSGSGSSYGTTSSSEGGEMTFRGHKVPIAFSLLVWCLVWEVVGRLGLISLIPPFTEVLGAMPEVMGSPSFAEAATITFQAYGIGMALSLTIGIGVGILMGRVRAIGELMGMWVNIFESSPLTAVVPALMALLGFGLPTMVVTVFLFSVWVIALDTQVGVERVNPSLVEMGRSFGATKRALCSRIVLRAALPELLAGIRLGLIRGLKGVIIGQLLIAVLGFGYLFELYSRSFLMPEFWALLIIVFAFAFLASEAVAYFERKVSFYATAR